MEIEPVQAALNGRFTYRAEQGDAWRILSGAGPIHGDCEDYALTLIWLLETQSMRRFWWALVSLKYVIWQCRAPTGQGHAVVWCRGHGWTDNIQRKLMARLPPGYRLSFPYLAPMVLLKFALRRVLSRG